jgi:ABC-type transporter Mla subunit MlaD
MKEQRNAIRAGLFMLLSIAMVIAIVIGIAGAERFTQTWSDRQAMFSLDDDIGGLAVGDDVRIGGFKVGVVRAIDLTGIENPTPDHPPAIYVTFSMPTRYVLRIGTHLAVQGTLTGQSWLNIDSLGTGAVLASSMPIQGQPSTTTVLTRAIGDAMPQVKSILSDLHTSTIPRINATADSATALLTEARQTTIPRVNTAADSANALLTDVRGRVEGVVARYDHVADSAAGAMDSVHDMLGPSASDFRGAVADLHEITSSVKTRAPQLMDSATAMVKRIDDAVAGAHQTLADLSTTAANARDATGDLKSILAGNRAKIDAMVVALKTTGDNLKNASAEIERSPWRLLYKPGPDEMANLNLFDAAREFAAGAADLNNSAIQLRDAVNDPKSNPDDIKKLLTGLDESFAKFQAVQTKLEQTVKP